MRVKRERLKDELKLESAATLRAQIATLLQQ
jgi:hypothetical protein